MESESSSLVKKQDALHDACKSGYLSVNVPVPFYGWVPAYLPLFFFPALCVTIVWFAVFIFPFFGQWAQTHGFTPFTGTMGQHLVYWLLVRYGLRFALSLITWQVYKWKGLSDDEVGLIAGPEIDIPTEKLRVRGGWAIYTIDSLGRKLPHMNNWAGLNAWAQAVTTTSWAAFQFDSMNSTIDVVVCLLLLRTVNFWVNVLHWLSVVRTADGYARRANKIFAATGSILGMGVTVPLCSGVLGMLFAEGRADRVAFEHALMTIVVNPAGYGDALAEVVGVHGKLRFQVYGMGETNTKSVEGMVAMFLGSTVLSLSDAWAIGGWPWLMLVGLLSTIAETWSPRAFDNVFIPFFASLGCAIALALQPGLVD